MYLRNTVRSADLHILDSAVLQHFINGLCAYAESRARFLHAHYFGIVLQYRLIYFFEIHCYKLPFCERHRRGYETLVRFRFLLIKLW